MDIKEKVRSLPASPGVYIMKGAERQVLYVGKAGNLRRGCRVIFTRIEG